MRSSLVGGTRRLFAGSTTLWVIAMLATVAAAAWQRATGPSHPFRGRVTVAGAAVRVRLPRSNLTTSGARVAVPADAGTSGTLYWRRYPTDDPFAAVPMRHEGGRLAAELPPQPAAGKVQYYVALERDGRTALLPARGVVVLRYRGPVPPAILAPHIGLMFLGLLFGIRAGLGAAVGEEGHRARVLAALTLFTVGGLVLGSITQKYAFGAYWTGVPFGWDLTDNKTLLMWIGWVVAALAGRSKAARWLVLGAAVLMLAAYGVPHSVQGSELDYSRLEQTAAPR